MASQYSSCVYDGDDNARCWTQADVASSSDELENGWTNVYIHVRDADARSGSDYEGPGLTARANGVAAGAIKYCLFGICGGGLSIGWNGTTWSVNWGSSDNFRNSRYASVACPPMYSGLVNTPIVFDLWNVDFHFVPPSVKFNIDGKGHIETIAWPDAGYGNAFLALPDDNGHITSGKQLFGNFTDQPPCPPSEKRCENGFRALAVYDSNNDNVIDSRDPIWSKLRLWTDSNMNGKVDLGELTALDLAGITSISLNYTPTDKYVAYGLLRYQGSVTGLADSTIYDVFLPSIK